MNRILLIGFEYLGAWRYARLSVTSGTEGCTLRVVLQDDDLQALLPANEAFNAWEGHLLVCKGQSHLQHQLLKAIATAIAKTLNLEIKYVSGLPGNNDD